MRILGMVLCIVTLFSCSQPEERYSRLSQIKDDSLKSAITRYAKSTSFNSKAQFISIECITGKNKTVFEISSGRSSYSYRSFSPDYFAVIDDIVVILWLTDGNTFEPKDIGNEIDHIMIEKGINLESKPFNYDPPVWTLIKCNAKYQLATQRNDTILEYLPCDYYLSLDWNTDSLTVHKRTKF